MRLASCLMLVAVFTIVGSASAQTAPVAPPTLVTAVVATALPAPASLPTGALEIDLAKILGASATGSVSSPQEPLWMSCTVPQCKRGCGCSFGCIPICTDVTTCECDCICG
jgi:hypothetical protein